MVVNGEGKASPVFSWGCKSRREDLIQPQRRRLEAAAGLAGRKDDCPGAPARLAHLGPARAVEHRGHDTRPSLLTVSEGDPRYQALVGTGTLAKYPSLSDPLAGPQRLTPLACLDAITPPFPLHLPTMRRSRRPFKTWPLKRLSSSTTEPGNRGSTPGRYRLGSKAGVRVLACVSKLAALIDRDLAPRLSAPRAQGFDLLHQVRPIGHLAEDDVLAVQPGGHHRGDEELRAVRVRAGIGHGQRNGLLCLSLKFSSLNLCRRSTCRRCRCGL